MSPSLETLRSVAEAGVPSLVSHLVASTVFLLLVLAALLVAGRRLTASARFWLAFLGIVKFAIPGEAIVGALRSLAGSLVPDYFAAPLVTPLSNVGGALHAAAMPDARAVWPAVAAILWLVVTVALVARFALVRGRLVALSVRTALPPRANEVEALARAKRRVGVRRSIDIARAALPEAPAVLRVFRPLIVLPATDIDDLADDELEALLRHECAHVARHDNLLTTIEAVVGAVFWFHPLLWIAQRIVATERERACDESVAGSPDERDTYLNALTKFCHAAIAPRLPGISCMATARMKERMDYVMEYATLKTHAPAAPRVAAIAAAALVLFTLAAGFGGPEAAFAGTEKPYAIRVTAAGTGETITVDAAVSENASGKVIVAPVLIMDAGGAATAQSSVSGVDVAFAARQTQDGFVTVDVTISRDGREIQRHKSVIRVAAAEPAEEKYTGQPITLSLHEAEIRDVVATFGTLTGLEMKVDDSVEGKVSVNWENVPWDEAFDILLEEKGLTYRIDGSTIHITKK
ncbi:MAG: M56 family metallopeptidase [Thermoanaerobaculia bacterium]